LENFNVSFFKEKQPSFCGQKRPNSLTVLAPPPLFDYLYSFSVSKIFLKQIAKSYESKYLHRSIYFRWKKELNVKKKMKINRKIHHTLLSIPPLLYYNIKQFGIFYNPMITFSDIPFRFLLFLSFWQSCLLRKFCKSNKKLSKNRKKQLKRKKWQNLCKVIKKQKQFETITSIPPSTTLYFVTKNNH